MSELKTVIIETLTSKPKKLDKDKIKEDIKRVKSQIKNEPEKVPFGLNSELKKLERKLEKAKKPDSVFFNFGDVDGVFVKRTYLQRLKNPEKYINGLYARKMYSKGLKAIDKGEYGTARSIEALLERQDVKEISEVADKLGRQIELRRKSRGEEMTEEESFLDEEFAKRFDKGKTRYTRIVTSDDEGNEISIQHI